MNDFSNLQISKLIIHRIFKRGDNGELVEPDYSNNPIILNLSESSVIRERLVSALGKHSKSLLMDIVNRDEGTTIDLVSKLFDCSDEEFTFLTKGIALKLAEAQTYKRITDCALFIIKGTTGVLNIPFACIVKSESQSAFRLIEGLAHEKSLELIEDALLGKDQKLYKIGFIGNIDKEINDFEIVVFDSNLDQFKTSNAAKYFYINFLGCKIKENSAKLTKDFYDETTDYINTLNLRAFKKFDLQNQLNSYLLADGNNLINCMEFANQVFINADIIDDYLIKMESKHLTEQSIHKDNNLIDKKLKKRFMNFSNGIRIIGDQNTFDESIQFVQNESGVVIIQINGELLNQS